MAKQVYSPDGSMDNPDNHPLMTRLMTIQRASLLKQAEGMEIQRRAILTQAAEIEKLLGQRGDNIPIKIGDTDSVSGA
jgi:hypothetical protein